MIARVYLAGPIDNCTDEEVHEWREYVKANAHGRFNCVDPTRRDYRGKELTVQHNKEIVELDKIDITHSDCLLANLSLPKKMTGTIMEILYAWERGKLVILVTPEARISPWLTYHSSMICENLESAIAYVKQYYGPQEFDPTCITRMREVLRG